MGSRGGEGGIACDNHAVTMDAGTRNPPVETPAEAAEVEHVDADDVSVLAWYRNPWNIFASLFAVLVLAGTGGFVLGERYATPDSNSTDIGFLQDMRAHHEQGVSMSMAFFDKSDVSSQIETVAQDIIWGQSIEIGRMVQLLREYGGDEANLSGTGMAWMNHSMPLERMPGMATEADLEALVAANGQDADRLFIQLMVLHHRGGIEMAAYARDHAGSDEVKRLAASVVTGQESEIVELERLTPG